MHNTCPFCSAEGRWTPHRAREMMFGRRDVFEYRECGACGSLWLADELTPEQLASYYGDGYYSYTKQHDGRLHTWLLNQRDRASLGGWTPIGRMMVLRRPNATMEMIGRLAPSRDARILDVGCGGGRLLDRLKAVGFTRLLGVDPYVAADQVSANGVPIRKGYLADLDEMSDLIMFNHSMEHVARPVEELHAVRDHLVPGGRCLVRIPTVSSEAWKRYGVDWVQLDAPRHLAIPSRDGMARAVEAAGLKLIDTIDDSNAFQFEGSERYRVDVPLLNGVFAVDPARRASFEAESKRLNAEARGDQTGFMLAR